MSLKNFLILIFLANLWGLSFIFLRLGADVFGAGMLIEIRVVSASLFVLLLAFVLKRQLSFSQHRANFPAYLFIGFFNIALPFVLFAYAAHHLDASLLSVLNSSAPIFAAFLGIIWLKTHFTASIFIGLILGVIGVIVLSWDGLSHNSEFALLPLVASLVAAFCYGLATVYAKRYAPKGQPIDNALGTLIFASVLVMPFALFIPVEQTPMAIDWIWALALGVLSTGLAIILYFRLIEQEGPVKALSVTFIIPIFGILWGHIFLDEAIGWNLLIGGLLILIAIALTNELVQPANWFRSPQTKKS